MSYAPIFCQVAVLMKIHNCGHFHQYNICDCQVKNFQSFWYRFSIHGMVVSFIYLFIYLFIYSFIYLFIYLFIYFSVGFGTLPHRIWSDFVQIFTRGNIQAGKRYVLRIFEKFKYWQKTDVPKVCYFGPTLTPRFPLKMAEIEQSKDSLRKNVSHRAIETCQNQAPISSALSRKNTINFCYISAFFAKKGAWWHVQMSESKFHILFCSLAIPGHLPVKTFCFQNFPVLWL